MSHDDPKPTAETAAPVATPTVEVVPAPKPRRAKKPATEKATKPAKAEPVTDAEPVEAAEPAEPEELSDEEVETVGKIEEGEVEEAEVVAPLPKAIARPEAGVAPRNALQQYMREVERHPLLTREEEHDLAVRYREKGDVDAAYKLVTANLRLVVKIAHEYHRTAFSLLDLVQEGNVGLMHAVRKFDPYRGVKLSSYSAWWIRAYILRYVMENWRIVKLGTTQAQRKLFFNLRKEQARLAAEGFDPTPKLLAERLNVSEQEVTEMDQRLAQDEFSLDAPLNGDDSGKSSRADRFASATQAADDSLADHELKEILRGKLAEFGKKLKDKERYIFEKRLVAEEPMTLQEIGDHYGLTRERARQIEAKLVRELKAWIQREVPDFKDLEIGPRSSD